jgi:type III pantothenate kinase
MDAVIDVGNTNTKIAFFQGKEAPEVITFPTQPFSNFYKDLSNRSFRHCLVSSVVDLPDHVIHYLRGKSKKLILLSAALKLPVKITYGTPGTLGSDRIALVCGAAVKYPGKDILIISAGTCITYNFLNAKGEFPGGAISPGLQMRLVAMHKMTAGLPLAAPTPDPVPLVGNTTESSLLSGALNGAILEIEGYINTLKHTNPALEVLLCGGDCRYLGSRLSTPVIIEQELALNGLHKILTLNV